jgi:hypothetical protein
MSRIAAISVAAAAVAALAPLQAGGSSGGPLPRATVDRLDDRSGLQIHVMYVLPSDRVDRGFDTDGSIENSVSAFQRWLRAQTNGRSLRLDTFQGSLDITFHRLARTNAEIAARGRGARDLIEQELRAAGLVTSRKVYPVYYDGTNAEVCGGGPWPPALPGTVSAFYLGGAIPGLPPCFAGGFAPPGAPPAYTEFAMLHDVVHAFGIVSPCAPHHHDAGHVNETPQDLMWSGAGSWNPSILDFGRDDYYEAGIPGCPDLATAGFLTADADFQLSVLKEGDGGGTVTSTPWTLIECGSSCSAAYGRGTVVPLAATANADAVFTGWGGACSGMGACAVTMDGSKTVTARFTLRPRTLLVNLRGRGAGRVTSEPSGIRCPPLCSAGFPHTTVTLQATALPGSSLVAWGDACSGSGPCVVEMNVAKNVSATFADVQAPSVYASPSSGRRGRTALLRYRVADNGGEARVTIQLLGGGRSRTVSRVGFRAVSATRSYAGRWRVPRRARKGSRRFCVRAYDRSGHSSRSCARLKIR